MCSSPSNRDVENRRADEKTLPKPPSNPLETSQIERGLTAILIRFPRSYRGKVRLCQVRRYQEIRCRPCRSRFPVKLMKNETLSK